MHYRDSLPPPLNNIQSSSFQNPHEEALQALCKQILRSRLFRGYYEERRYVDKVGAYRDIVKLQRSERKLEKMLLDIKVKLHLFYQQREQHWIGITNESLTGAPEQLYSLNTCIWVELDELAFGEYWFNIKSVRFREHEIIIKLKVVRPVEADLLETSATMKREMFTSAASMHKMITHKCTSTIDGVSSSTTFSEKKVSWNDFVDVVQNWNDCIKTSAYDFISNDISKKNIKSTLRVVGLILVSLISGILAAVKFLGIFTLRFMFELSRFTHVAMPLLIKCIDLFNKIIGGFYIILTMIWKDLVVNRNKMSASNLPPQIMYRPVYPEIQYMKPRSIEYNVNRNTDNYEFKH